MWNDPLLSLMLILWFFIEGKKDDIDFKLESPHQLVNGEHEKEATIDTLKSTAELLARKPELEDSDSRHSADGRFPMSYPSISDDYTHLLSSWPKVRFICFTTITNWNPPRSCSDGELGQFVNHSDLVIETIRIELGSARNPKTCNKSRRCWTN